MHMKFPLILFPLSFFLVLISNQKSFSQDIIPLVVDADSTIKKQLEDYLKSKEKSDDKLRYTILERKPDPRKYYKMLYVKIDTTIDYKILVYNPDKKSVDKKLSRYFQKIIPDSLIKPKK